MRIDVYSVGLLSDLRHVWRVFVTKRSAVPPIARRHVLRNLRRALLMHVWRNVRRGRWREIKNYFNGYLAEPTPWPEGMRRCGSGWTRNRALRSLQRQVRRPGVLWEPVDREIRAIRLAKCRRQA